MVDVLKISVGDYGTEKLISSKILLAYQNLSPLIDKIRLLNLFHLPKSIPTFRKASRLPPTSTNLMAIFQILQNHMQMLPSDHVLNAESRRLVNKHINISPQILSNVSSSH